MKFSVVFRLVALISIVAVIIWIIADGLQPARRETSQTLAVIQQTQQIPSPESTIQLPIGSVTTTAIPLPPTPYIQATHTIAALQTPVLISPTLVSSMTLDLSMNPGLSLISVGTSTEPIVSMAWAPTGDKLLYVTTLGNLYWSNPDGTGATLLHTYESDMVLDLLRDQRPMTNTLLIRHVGPPQGMTRAPGHLDVVRFTPGQPPTLEEVPDAGDLTNIYWWSPDRASGRLWTNIDGGERLVTVDANGLVVEERDVPYMFWGAVRPGGEWLAYSTDTRNTSRPFVGAAPSTAYLLNLTTGQRLQISPSEKGVIVNWSPDGNWLLMGSEINGEGRMMLSSPDGLVRIAIPTYGWSPVWSPDSQQILFYSVGDEELEHGAERITPVPTPVGPSSTLEIVDVLGRRVGKADRNILPPNSPGQMMKPAWSPDGSQLVLLAWDPECSGGECSGLAPAFYLMSTR